MLKQVLGRLAVLTAILMMAACAGPGERKEITVLVPQLDAGRPAEVFTIVVHNRQVPKYLLDSDKVALNFLVKGRPTEGQKKAVAAVEVGCRQYAKLANPHPLVTIGSQAILFGAIGYVSGYAASDAFTRTIPAQYARYVSTLNLGSGAGGGILNSASERHSSFEDCGEELFIRAPRGTWVLR